MQAVNDFHRARRQASLELIMARLRGKSAYLLSYEEVRDKLKARSTKRAELRDIPLDAIVGSVGRYTDFTRSFLPLQDQDEQRWARVQLAVTDMRGVPPIDVYQIGEVYFVRDGNHRVSVARQFGASHIQAYVVEIESRVHLSADVRPDDLIIKAEYTDFLERTGLDEIRPQADLTLTVPGRYDQLLEHIAVHRYFMGRRQERAIPFEEAVAQWYDNVYLPVVQIIRQQSILRDFPDRTETDLYLWILTHRAELEEALGWEVATESAASDFAAQFGTRRPPLLARVGGKLLDAVTPDPLEAGPAPGRWREERLAARPDDRLFADILVPLSGEPDGWRALEQALIVAGHEGARLRGLHVVASEDLVQSEDTQRLRTKFQDRCAEAGIPGSLAVETGKIARAICERARWTDLAVVSLAHPPGPRPAARLSSGFRMLIRRCPRPVLAVPGTPSPLSRALLAYDGSRKADEALFVATYLAARWEIPLVVVTALEDEVVQPEVLVRAQEYLETHDIRASYVEAERPAAEAILATAEENACDLILMGGYGHSPVVEVVLGSTVDQVLRESSQPILVCH
jgi:nucleotide-binding universal stress UspA family protein